MGLGFRLPAVFGYSRYNEPPSAQGSQYNAVGTFRLDVQGLAQCYRTADGVGVGGPTMAADTKGRKVGVSWRWAVLLVVLVVSVWALAPGVLANVIYRFFGKVAGQGDKLKAVQTNSQHMAIAKAVVQSTNVQSQIVIYTNGPFVLVVVAVNTNRIWLTGAIKTDAGYTLSLSDGRILGPAQVVRVVEDGRGIISAVLPDKTVVDWSGPSLPIPVEKRR